MKKFLLCAFVALASISASAKDVVTDTLVVTTNPQMHCKNCENKIKSNIRFVKGVKKIETSVPNHTVTIVYDKSKSNYDNFVAAFKKIGFEIKPVKE